MKLEDQVVSVELAKELKELDIKQDSMFYWIQCGEYINDWSEAFLEMKEDVKKYEMDSDGQCSAYTVAELGEILPIFTSTSKIIGFPFLGWRCVLEIPLSKVHYEEAGTEADARAKMGIYLIKEKIVKVEELEK